MNLHIDTNNNIHINTSIHICERLEEKLQKKVVSLRIISYNMNRTVQILAKSLTRLNGETAVCGGIRYRERERGAEVPES